MSLAVVATFLAIRTAHADEISFDRDIAPILEQRCVRCHGPEALKGGLSLATRELAVKGGESGPAVVAGKPGESLLLEMVTGEKPSMPNQGRKLTAAEVAKLRQWIEQGAPWPAEHKLAEKAPDNREWWSLQPVRKPAVPRSANLPPNGNAIDAFVAAKLAAAGLTMSPPTDKRSLIRRVSLDLWGLPPTPEEVAAFVKSDDPAAYLALVNQRLNSRHFGERYAAYWLDLVRFAETHGFEMNQERPTAWHYRDYVIRAFQEDKPYDQFLREQLAGDVLGADEATGFLVAGPWDQVKSPDPVLTANQRADELHDIVSATGATFLGLTVGCARCHDHKFDPVPQVDYYALKAVFEGVQHGERELKSQDTPERKERLSKLESVRAEMEARLFVLEPLARTEPAASDAPAVAVRLPVTPRTNRERFEPVEARFVRFTILESQSEPCLDELEVFTAEAPPRNIALASQGTKATASGTYPGTAIHKLEHIHDGKYGNEWSWISNTPGRGWMQLEFPEVVKIDRARWGRDQALPPKYSDRLATKYRIEVSLDGQAWKSVATSDDRLPIGAPVGNLTEELKSLQSKQAELAEQLAALSRSPAIYAGRMIAPGVTNRLHRGDPTQPREAINPGPLSAIAVKFDLPDASNNAQRRFALANWIASPDNPLTARVIVNRLWQWHFGEGLVSTPSDLGVNGALPTHPELLDWLAAELMEHNWSLKHIQRLIVTSATYQQSSRGRAECLQHDAATRLLWRFPSRRLEAEPLRDAMLATTGKLDLAPGGLGFSPFEPNGNYVRVYTPKTAFTAADFRRMIYMTRIRMQVDPTFGVFDCPDGGQAAPKRSRSTTPLQALNLLNSALALEQAKLFAERLQREAGDDAAAQVQRAFQLAFQREPSAVELAASVAVVREQGLPVFCRVLFNSNEFAYLD